jgi:hypothetical protein
VDDGYARLPGAGYEALHPPGGLQNRAT